MQQRAALQQRLNRFGKRREACFFLIDFAAESGQVWSLDQLSAEELMVDFPEFSNLPMWIAPPAKPLFWAIDPPVMQHYRAGYGLVVNGLQAGDSYLVNYTMPARLQTNYSLRELMLASSATYRIWWRNRFTCFSPETFVRIEANHITTYPMKGTAPNNPAAAERLLADPKEQAEHATIVDLLRNDLSRVSKRVRVERYRYLTPTVRSGGGLLQTISQIGGKLPDNWQRKMGDLLFELLPAGSVSGAPKASTMRLIQEAEGQSRGFYCGIAGLFTGDRLETAILIRFVERLPNNQLQFWAGGGITANSEPEKEYAELIGKMHLPVPSAEPTKELSVKLMANAPKWSVR